MTEDASKLIQQMILRRFEYLPKVDTPEQRKGALGIVNLFALASHMLTAMSGTLAIVSIDRGGIEGQRRDPGLHRQIHRLVYLAVQTSASLTRLIGIAMAMLHSEQITTQSATEREGIQEVMAMGYIYMESLDAVSLETTNVARWRKVWGSGDSVPPGPLSVQPCDPEADKARQSVDTLIAQIIDLGLRAELFDGAWSME